MGVCMGVWVGVWVWSGCMSVRARSVHVVGGWVGARELILRQAPTTQAALLACARLLFSVYSFFEMAQNSHKSTS